jgi:hypothetical protein
LPRFSVESEKIWKITVKDLNLNKEKVFIAPYVCVATGHHAAPRYAQLPGQETFPGKKPFIRRKKKHQAVYIFILQILSVKFLI